MIRKLIGVLALGIVAALGGVQVAGAQYSEAPTVEIDDTTVEAGDELGVTGSNCPPGSTVTLTIDGEVVGTTTAGDDGTFATDVTVPAGLTPGTYTLTAECDGQTATTQFDVVAAGGGGGDPGGGGGTGGGGTGGGALARTGTDLDLPVQIGVALVALGGVAMALSSGRRRRTTA